MSAEQEIIVSFDEDEILEISALVNHADKIPELMSQAANLSPKIGTLLLSDQLSQKLALDLSDIHSMINGLIRICRLRNDLPAAQEAANVIAFSLEKAKQPDLAKSWRNVQDKVTHACDALTEEHPFFVSYEAGSEMLSIPNVVLSLEMSTGTRPVFNQAKDRVLFTIINHTLSLEYHEAFRRHREITISLDAGDLDKLRELCAQAEQAAATLRATIPGPSAVPWENDDEDTH